MFTQLFKTAHIVWVKNSTMNFYCSHSNLLWLMDYEQDKSQATN